MAPADLASDAGIKIVGTNRKAFHNYHVLERIEAGLELRGAEVKSLRAGHFSIAESYARVRNGEVRLHDFHIQPYAHARVEEHDPVRPKRLLLTRREIDRLFGKASLRGHALIPLRLYFKHGLAKVEIGLCRGKQAEDKRETMRRRTAEREAERAIAARTRRK
jgi:SsrA-binding protein